MALGRVIAHELYHVLTQTRHHMTSGIAKAAYTEYELLCPPLNFREKEFHTLLAQNR